ncbi:hypothetical protein HS7_13420 [Sulfolobales archaeon HS-7]|nr:hypothetical protein HS7_13420 [Sulfolobales archaeon HS-7]
MSNYTFVPLVNGAKYELSSEKEKIFSIGNGNSGEFKVQLENSNHISKIEQKSDDNNKKFVVIHNILVLTGYAVDKKSFRLVSTLDPCDYVRGILIGGQIKQNNNQYKVKTITFAKHEVTNKLYFIRKSDFYLKDDVTINLSLQENESVGRTEYNSLNIDDNNMKGINELYKIDDPDAIEDLKKKLNEIVSYYTLKS